MRPLALTLVLVTSLGTGCAQGNPAPPIDTASPGNPAAPADTTQAQAVAPFESEDDYRTQRAAAAAALDAAITPATASAVDACRVVPTSEQACGGPASFAVFSAEAADVAEVERLAGRLVALDVQANGQFGWASTCMAYSPPTPTLRDGRCVVPE